MIILIYIGLALIPYFFIPGMDVRTPKEILGLGLALSIVLHTFHVGGFKKVSNYWILIFLFSIYVSTIMSPPFRNFVIAHFNGKEVSLFPEKPLANLWMFKSMFYLLVYSMMMFAVASKEFSIKQLDNVLKVMAISGFVMALYIFVQQFHLDQFWQKVTPLQNVDVNHLKKPLLGGFMGQSTVVSPFIAFLVPIALYLRKYLWAVCMCVAVGLTVSKVANIALVVGVITYFMCIKRRFCKFIGIFLLLCVLSGSLYFIKTNGLYEPAKANKFLINASSGRTEVWQGAIKAFTTEYEGKLRTITGFGPDSFRYFYSTTRKNRWVMAHCDPMEAIINFGLLGAAFIYLAGVWFVKNIIKTEFTVSLLCSLLILMLTSLGTFSLQIATNIFYAVVIIGILSNKTFERIDHAKT